MARRKTKTSSACARLDVTTPTPIAVVPNKNYELLEMRVLASRMTDSLHAIREYKAQCEKMVEIVHGRMFLLEKKIKAMEEQKTRVPQKVSAWQRLKRWLFKATTYLTHQTGLKIK